MDASTSAYDVDGYLLECRERELENTQRALTSARAQVAHARVLLLRVKEALDVALEETEQEGDGG